MGKNYRKKGSRSRRKSSRRKGEVINFASSDGSAAVQMVLPVAELLAGVKGALEALSTEAGLLVMQALLEEEVEQVAGVRYAHGEDGSAHRWGQEEGYVIYAGRKVPVRRPRVRKDDKEVGLSRYQLFQAPGRMQEEVARRVLNRVATRRYEAVIDEVADGYGIGKSSVSRHWKIASARQLQELMERPLDGLDLGVIVIDGIHFQEYLLVAAIGVDSSGKKHILGLWEGASENATVVGELLDNLIERGLCPEKNYLFVLDGAKALRKGVVSRFGKQTAIQRCTVHKEGNILDHLPKKYHVGVRMRLRAAWNMKGYQQAREALLAVLAYLQELCPAAAKSLEEAFEDTLTLHRLGVGETLRKSLRSTNIIESCFSTTRDLCRNVKRWRTAEMAWRWAGTAMLEAEKRFRRVRGCREMAMLIAKLEELLDKRKEAVA